jgi:Fe-S oxidoreductase
MDQAELRQWEQRCIQEEPPPCSAACPLHLDVRSVVGHIGQGRWANALGILHKTLPVAGILGRICDAPCRLACNRKDAGQAIRIDALERICVTHADGQRRVMPLPPKGIRVAVVGGGLSSLTVAWDLVRKGYGISVFEPESVAGDLLCRHHPDRLTATVVAAETDLLSRLGVGFKTDRQLATAADIQGCLEAHGAVYVGLDAVAAEPWMTRAKQIDDHTGQTACPGLFAGGDHPSPVWRAALGRWAATSMDRWLQNVSMSAGREREGPYETRLFTNLAGVAPLPAVPMADPQTGYRPPEATREAGRCLQCQCLECVKVCAYLTSFGAYPKKYVREIYNNQAMVMGERKANRLINSCSLCGLCETVCPHDFAMQDLCLSARQNMVDRGKMPPSAHDFALEDMAFSQSERFALARHAPGSTTSQHLFFPGCQLCASSPGQVRRIYDHLRSRLSGGVALMLGCCGAPAHWAGRQETVTTAMACWQETWTGLGRPRPIMACATCLKMFTSHLAHTEATSLWEVLEETGIPESGLYRPEAPVAVHDPCTTRAEPAVQDAVRRLLSKMGVVAEEMILGRSKTECCGFGGLMQNANPVLAREVAERRGRHSSRDYLAYCAMCRDNLAAAGRPTMHLLDLLFPEPTIADPGRRPRPGWSRRQENRWRLKVDLERELWDEQPASDADHRRIVLRISPDVAAVLESRRILEEDIQKVIQHAQGGGPWFYHPDTGHILASFRPYQATFWVAYSRAADGFSVHNAYAHRMEVLGP